MNYDNDWFTLVLNLRASVIRDIKYQVAITTIFALAIAFLYEKGYTRLSQPTLGCDRRVRFNR